MTKAIYNHWLKIPETSMSLINDIIQFGKEWLGEDHIAIKCLKLGIAVHHGGLPRAFLQPVEQLIKKNICKNCYIFTNFSSRIKFICKLSHCTFNIS